MYCSVLDRLIHASPERVLYKDEFRTVTWGEFLTASDAAGTYLAGMVGPASPVAVMTGRHVWTPACFLGVVKAGCFYAPMDGDLPKARLEQMLRVVQAPVLLVDRAHLETAQGLEFHGEIVVMEEILQTAADPELLASRRAALTVTSPLYVIFTSGSSGTPKGVITSHESLICYIDAVIKVLNIDESDILGNQSPLDYIAAIRDVYIPLFTGASTYIIPKNEFAIPGQLFETLNRERVTTLCWSVAGVELPAKLGAFELGKPQYLKKLCFSGSVIHSRYLRIWQENLPDVMYVNQYGPTEATASCTYYVIDHPVSDDTVLPIGVPYENYRIFLLKEDETAAAPGEIGEICVSGPILALGYYGNQAYTEKAFVQNPLNPYYRELIYKTGDLGRYNENGLLEFHGRKDRQIKHLGHRIELSEIEETAGRINGVQDCCALYDKERELLYLFYTGEAASKEIVLYFRQNMPSYMVPRKTVRLDEMPRLPNGKTDMQTLKQYFHS